MSTAGHWTIYLFPKVEPPGTESIPTLIEVAIGRWAEEVQSSLRADSWNSVPTLQGFAWGHKSEKNVVKWFEHTFLYNSHDFRQPWTEIQLPEYEYVLAVFFFLNFHFFFMF